MKSELSFAQVFGPQQIKSGFDGAPTKSKFFHVELTCENYYEKASLFSVLEKKMYDTHKFERQVNPNV